MVRTTFPVALSDIWPLPIVDCVRISELSRMPSMIELKRMSNLCYRSLADSVV